MRKIGPKSIVEFIRKRSPKGKSNFVNRLKQPLPPKTGEESGGDYWSSCLAAITHAYKELDPDFLSLKIVDLQERLRTTKRPQTRNMYQKNIEILQHFQHYNLNKLRTSTKVVFIPKSGANPILKFGELDVTAASKHLYIVQDKETEALGAIWFVAQLGGYSKAELGVFTDVLFRYLKQNYSKDYRLDTKYCLAVDVVATQQVSYAQLENGAVSMLLSPVLSEMRRLLQGP